MNTVRSLLPLLRLHRWAFPAMLTLGLLQSLSEGIGIGLFLPLLRGLISGTGSQAGGGWLMERLDAVFRQVPQDDRLAVIALSLFAVVLVTALLAYAHGVLFTWVDGSIAHHLRRTIFGQLLVMNFGTIERDRSGRLLNILASDTWRTSEALKIVVHLVITISTVDGVRRPAAADVVAADRAGRRRDAARLGHRPAVHTRREGARRAGRPIQLRARAPDGRGHRRDARDPGLRARAVRAGPVRHGVGAAAAGHPEDRIHRRRRAPGARDPRVRACSWQCSLPRRGPRPTCPSCSCSSSCSTDCSRASRTSSRRGSG